MRVLVVARDLGSDGGIERCQLAICQGLAQRGHMIDLVYQQPGDLLREWQDISTRMKRVGTYLWDGRRPARLAGGFALSVRAALGVRPDVIYTHFPEHNFYGAVLGALWRRPVVAHLHLPCDGERNPSTQIRVGIDRVQRFISVSEATAREWMGLGIPGAMMDVVRNGVDTRRFRPAAPGERLATRARLGVAEDAFMMLYLGRLDREKGIEILMSAARRLSSPQGKAVVAIAGKPNVMARWGEGDSYMADLLRCADGVPVQWLGHQGDVLPVIQAADVLVLPSLWSEPFGLVLAEALACEVPVVASRTGGIPEILSGEFERCLVEPGDDRALAAALEGLWRWRETVPDLGARGRAHVLRHFTVERMVEGVESSLERAVSTAGGKTQLPGRVG